MAFPPQYRQIPLEIIPAKNLTYSITFIGK